VDAKVRNTVPAENSVAVFFTRVPYLTGDQISSLLHCLSPEELDRASRFVFEKDRQLYITAHALLHYCLDCAACEPKQKFLVGPYGKPELEPPFGDPPLRFNLSHTNGMVACALSRGYVLGVDVEEINRSLNLEAIVRRAFAPEEQRLLADKKDAERSETFFRLWALKEAIIKGIGRGLALPMQSFEFKLDPISLSISAEVGEDSDAWQMHELVPSPVHRLAVAVKRTSRTDLPVTSAEITIVGLIEWSDGTAVGVKGAGRTPELS
jgi:4'-phosphopantetheinyl transferase